MFHVSCAYACSGWTQEGIRGSGEYNRTRLGPAADGYDSSAGVCCPTGDWWLRFPPATGSTITDTKLQQLADYFGRTWVRGEFPAELWTQFDNNGPRTTNAAEGWHNSLNTHHATPVTSRLWTCQSR